MPVAIKGSGGGSVTLDAGAAATDTTLTLPNTSGTLLQSGTAVTAAQGGTGLTSPGTAGNILTSTGSAWASSAPAASGAINFQTFTSSGTWTKPSGYSANSRVFIQTWGGGGSGGKGAAGSGGAGGGGYNERWVTLSAMGATETVTVGAGGTAITAASTNGNTGGTTSLGSLISAYGGAGGVNGSSSSGNGGGGGGQLAAGTNITNSSFDATTIPGQPYILATFGYNACVSINTIAYSGGGAVGTISAPAAYMHGGGGGLYTGGTKVGAASVWGGGGGGGSNGSGAGGVSSFGGAGGAGGTAGTNGTQPAGGGGGSTTGTSGAGGAGQIYVTVFPA